VAGWVCARMRCVLLVQLNKGSWGGVQIALCRHSVSARVGRVWITMRCRERKIFRPPMGKEKECEARGVQEKVQFGL